MTREDTAMTDSVSAFPLENLPTGIKKTIMSSGSGWESPMNLYEVKVRLSGRYGEMSMDIENGHPQSFVVGSGLPCKGLDLVFKGMKKGEKAKVTIEAPLAFGPGGLLDKAVPPVSEVTFDVEMLDWFKVEDITKKHDQGILVKTLEEGHEWDKPGDNDIVFLRYRGRTLNEETYFEVEGFGENTEALRIPTKQISPAGLLHAVKHLKKSSKAIITLKPEYAFGSAGIPDKAVPPEASVEYEVELADLHVVTDVTKDGGVIMEVLNKVPDEWNKPTETSRCVISYRSAVAGEAPWAQREYEVVERREVVIGAGSDDAIPDGLERALEQMVKGQSALVTVMPDYSFGDQGLDGKVKPGETVQFQVELHSFEEAPNMYDMAFASKKAYAEKVKEVGNSFFKTQRYRRALRRYEIAMGPFEYAENIANEADKQTAQEIKSACLLNLAACHEKMGDWSQVLARCNKALTLPSGHAKARFRRAKAYLQLARYQEARSDLDILAQQNPNDAAVQAMLRTAKKLQKAHDAQAKQVVDHWKSR